MDIAVIDCSSSKVPNIVDVLERLNCNIVLIDLASANEHSFDQYDAMVISGGPRLFTDQAQIKELTQWFRFIERVVCPILGICLGHQAIGLAAGAKVYRDTERRNTEIITTHKQHALLNQLSQNFEVATDHCEGISLPENYQLIGSSTWYQVEVMVNDKLKRYGVQFHPEVSGRAGEQLFKNFLQLAKN